ncbi:uncharacterized protein LOC126315451 [Schistocerca gregaria]|uniref:uncharacterized protein LOC126315451 n=1 Tax=Schistocerca gregaria TaxID=7010 RepID=UPI00211DF77B|nr:uncharacterized protein LOC126315451 [Schistocerca gregaria]
MDNSHRKPLSPLVVPDRLNQPIPSVHRDPGSLASKKTPTSITARARPAPALSPIFGKCLKSQASKFAAKTDKSAATTNPPASEENAPSQKTTTFKNFDEHKSGEAFRDVLQPKSNAEPRVLSVNRGASPAKTWNAPDLWAENQSLRVQVSRLSTELEELKNQSAFQKEKLLYRISQYQAAELKLTERLRKLESDLTCQNLLYQCAISTIEDLEENVRIREYEVEKTEQDKKLKAWIEANEGQRTSPDEDTIELELEI